MKLTGFGLIREINETVVDFGQHKKQKERNQLQQQVSVKNQALSKIDHAVAAAVDQLVQNGFDEDDAYQKVISHMNDIVTAYDLTGGGTE